tara:strand:- start:326 stop:661 length:336 start_codon:yes stop_codon:yes gene_type:complete
MKQKSISASAYRWKIPIQSAIEERTKDKPVKSNELQVRFNIPGSTVRQIVHYLRTIEHIPIGSGADGYFLARSVGEVEHTVKTLKSRAREMIKAADGILEHYHKDEQISLI